MLNYSVIICNIENNLFIFASNFITLVISVVIIVSEKDLVYYFWLFVINDLSRIPKCVELF